MPALFIRLPTNRNTGTATRGKDIERVERALRDQVDRQPVGEDVHDAGNADREHDRKAEHEERDERADNEESLHWRVSRFR